VDDIVSVKVLEGLGHLVGNVPDHLLGNLDFFIFVFLELRLQISSLYILHHDEETVVLLKKILPGRMCSIRRYADA